MQMILEEHSQIIEKMSLEQIKNYLNILEQKYADSIDSKLEGNIEILKEIAICRKKKKQLLEERVNQVSKNNHDKIDKDQKNSFVKQQDKVKPKPVKNNIYGNTVIDSMKFSYADEAWYINFHENGNSYQEKYDYGKKEMITCKEIRESQKQKFGNKHLKTMDIGCYMMLNNFDQIHNTDYSKRYFKNDLSYHIIYNFSQFFHRSSFSLAERYFLLLKAKKQKKHKKAIVTSPRLVNAAPFILGATMILGILGIHIQKEPKKYEETKHYATEQTFDNSINQIQEKTEAVSEESHSKDVTEIAQEKKNPVNAKKIEKQVETKQSLHDDYQLKELSLSDKVIDSKLTTNTSKLNCDHYNISLISAASKDQIFEVKDTQSLKDISLMELEKDYKIKYGDDVNLYVNFNGYDKDGNMMYQWIGWTDINQINPYDKTSNQSKLEQLYELKYQLTNNTNSLEKPGYQKVKTI